jgi:flavin reductase (DIM6/NTAB) family NADH-FMN oxidoreductase RutF
MSRGRSDITEADTPEKNFSFHAGAAECHVTSVVPRGAAMLDTTIAPTYAPISDTRELRRALGRFATGVTVVTTSGADGELAGLTANSFSSVSLDPPLILWSLGSNAASLPSFMRAGWFAVHVLGSHQQALSNRFATPADDKFAGLDVRAGLGGCPLLMDSLAHFECSVYDRVPAGDHVIFLGRVERMTHRDGEPLMYHAGRYCVPAVLA